MEQIETLVKEFLSDEGFTLKSALAYGGVGLAKVTGQANEIIGGVGFGHHQYGSERQARMSEILGELLFYWHVLVSTLDVPFDEIIAQYVSSYEATRNTVPREKEKPISLEDLMDMSRHVKKQDKDSKDKAVQDFLRELGSTNTKAHLDFHHQQEVERELDWKEKKRRREQSNEATKETWKP